MRVETDLKLGFKDVLIRPKRSTLKSRSLVELDRTFVFLHSKMQWCGVPIIAANMDTVGTFEVAEALAGHRMLCAIHKHYGLEEWRAFIERQKSDEIFARIMVSIGVMDEDYEKLAQIIAQHPELQFICIDVANGYAESFAEYVERVRQAHPDKTIIAGNVVTGEMVEQLLLSGADIVKVGIGPGSVCTTRVKTGVGYPQLSAVIECADAAHGLGGRIISDGGCAAAGDVAKAFGGGADFVMLGGMFAGHDESGGQLVERDGQHFKLFYGMSSDRAREKHGKRKDGYRGNEGRWISLPYRGPVKNTVEDILGGVRSAATYIGARRLKDMPKCATFVRVNNVINRVYERYTNESTN